MLSSVGEMRLQIRDGQFESDECHEQVHLASSLSSKRETQPDHPRKLIVSGNRLKGLPGPLLSLMSSIVELDVSNNSLICIGSGLAQLSSLRVLDARDNSLSKLHEDIVQCSQLEELNLGENNFDDFPCELLAMPRLKKLYLGSNKISHLPPDIKKMTGLQELFLGGNRLSYLPDQIAQLPYLAGLTLCHNNLAHLPLAMANMHSLESLLLHNNRLETLPPALLQLRQLHSISLRNNPLVSRFVREHVDEVPSLLELAARSVKKSKVPYCSQMLPQMIVDFLDTSQHCDNPACRGVYFQVCYRKVKFVDFCGKYRIPFLHYLCSPECHESVPGHSSAFSGQSSDDEQQDPKDRWKMQRVLLPEP